MGRYHSGFFDFIEDLKRVVTHEIAWHEEYKKQPFIPKDYIEGVIDTYKGALTMLECDYPDDLYARYPFLTKGEDDG